MSDLFDRSGGAVMRQSREQDLDRLIALALAAPGEAGAAVGDLPAPGDWRAGAIALRAAPIPATMHCMDVVDRFLRDPTLPALAVVDGQERPIGLVGRTHLLYEFARPFIRDLYARRPIRELMAPDPLVVDEGTGIEALGAEITAVGGGAFSAGFVVTAKGRYLGVGSALDVMRRLVARMAEHNRALDRAVEEAERANAAKTAFLANMSHELRTPLNAVLGFSEIIMTQMLGPVGHARYLEYVGDIHSSAEHLLSLINDLLDIAKADATGLPLDIEPVDPTSLATETLRMVAPRAEKAGVILAADLPERMPMITGDRRRLRQILLNLLSNAVKFTPDGGEVRLILEDVPPGPDQPACIRMMVADTGIGMSADQIPIALSRFGQIDSSLTRRHDGTGLGLPLSRALAELHGGGLTIDSTPGFGTTITVTLPHRAMVRPIGTDPVRADPGL
ncbi:MAG: histidine kinase [Tistrella sp.]|uniref:histidine kinase n=1 Tax=Tistrella mobilis TaxID=171437 RepID=A0A3B9IR12_9PROT|nr:histidine kinase [Tistrella sp.]HAE50304.1 histidine kinase [Tistrella mobilis]